MEYELLSKYFIKSQQNTNQFMMLDLIVKPPLNFLLKSMKMLDSFSIRMKLQSYWLKYIKQSTKSIC